MGPFCGTGVAQTLCLSVRLESSVGSVRLPICAIAQLWPAVLLNALATVRITRTGPYGAALSPSGHHYAVHITIGNGGIPSSVSQGGTPRPCVETFWYARSLLVPVRGRLRKRYAGHVQALALWTLAPEGCHACPGAGALSVSSHMCLPGTGAGAPNQGSGALPSAEDIAASAVLRVNPENSGSSGALDTAACPGGACVASILQARIAHRLVFSLDNP